MSSAKCVNRITEPQTSNTIQLQNGNETNRFGSMALARRDRDLAQARKDRSVGRPEGDMSISQPRGDTSIACDPSPPYSQSKIIM